MTELEYLTVSLTEQEEKRIFSHITIDPITGCWNWIGTRNRKGYGHVKYRGRLESVHRVMYASRMGSIPRGVGKDIPVVDHICNNESCCNPDHLRLATQSENILSGTGASAQHARKKYCKNGHLLPDQPNYIDPHGNGTRVCRICTYELEHSQARKIAQKRARYLREQGPRRDEWLRKRREQVALKREKIRHSEATP